MVMFWVQLHNTLLVSINKETCQFLGSLIGEVVEVDSGVAGNYFVKDCLLSPIGGFNGQDNVKFKTWLLTSSSPKNRASKANSGVFSSPKSTGPSVEAVNMELVFMENGCSHEINGYSWGYPTQLGQASLVSGKLCIEYLTARNGAVGVLDVNNGNNSGL
ncbi:hypothetical protein ACOSP7_017999 [Xanthoceras sorbifolium]